MPLTRHAFAILVALAALAQAAQADPYSYSTHALQLIDLGAGVNPTAINIVGQVVGQGANSQAFLWTAGATTPLGTIGGAQSYANDINDSGVVVGWSHDADGLQRAFRWDSVNGITNIGGTSATLQNVAEAINSQGDIIGWRTNGTVYRTSLWNEANPTGVALFNTNGDTKGFGINDAGYVVGITVETDGTPAQGYYWDGVTGGGTQYTSQMGANYLPYAGIKLSNLTAGIQFGEAAFLVAGDENPFRFGKIRETDAFSIANGLNDLGQFVGESDGKGFVYDIPSDVMLDLNGFPRVTPGFGQVLRLTDLNNDGTFTGVALIDGVEHGIVGQLIAVPEPSTWALLFLGLTGLAIAARKRVCSCR